MSWLLADQSAQQLSACCSCSMSFKAAAEPCQNEGGRADSALTSWEDVLCLWIISVVVVPAGDPPGHWHGQPGSCHTRKAWLGRLPGAFIQPGAVLGPVLGPNGAHWPHPPSQHRLSEDQVGVASRLVDLGIFKLTTERHGADRCYVQAGAKDNVWPKGLLTQSKQLSVTCG